MNIPENLKYTKDHEWAQIDGNIATIGITDHAQSSLGDVVFLELPPIGRLLEIHKTFGVVESIKAVSDLFSPVSGKVIEINNEAVNEPAAVNKEPYTKGWMIKVEMTKGEETGTLLDAASYKKLVDSLH